MGMAFKDWDSRRQKKTNEGNFKLLNIIDDWQARRKRIPNRQCPREETISTELIDLTLCTGLRFFKSRYQRANYIRTIMILVIEKTLGRYVSAVIIHG